MKKLLYILFFAIAAFCSCKKDTSTDVSITHADLSSLNSQLKGTWVFPVQTYSVVDSTGKVLSPAQSQPSPALQFDGSSKVNIMPDSKTVLKGTYRLSTDKGLIYITVDYPDGSSVQYQVLSMNDQTLKLTSSQPYPYFNGTDVVTANAVVSTVLSRQNSVDVTGHFVKITASSDSSFNIGVYVKHPGADTAALVTQRSSVTGPFNYSFTAKPGDHLQLDIFSGGNTTFYVYYDGIPITGEVDLLGNELKTDTGWDIP